MATVNNPDLAEKVKIRILEIMDSAGLEIVGLAQAINISSSHLRSLLNRTKPITAEVADLMSEFVGIDIAYFFTFEKKLPSDIRTRTFVARFRSKYANSSEYFIDTRYDRDDNYLIEVEIYSGNFFNSPRYVGEVVEYIRNNYSKVYESKRVAQILNGMAAKELLFKEERRILLKNEKLGNRKVSVYYKNK